MPRLVTIFVDDNPASSGDYANITGNMLGAGSLVKTGPGLLIVSGTNSFNGSITVSQGELMMQNNSNPNFALGGVTVASGTTLGFGGGSSATAFSGAINTSGTVHFTGYDTVTLTGPISGSVP